MNPTMSLRFDFLTNSLSSQKGKESFSPILCLTELSPYLKYLSFVSNFVEDNHKINLKHLYRYPKIEECSVGISTFRQSSHTCRAFILLQCCYRKMLKFFEALAKIENIFKFQTYQHVTFNIEALIIL